MKYVIVLSDGMADEPLAELGQRTPMEAADTPSMDRLAQKSEVGLVRTVPIGMSPGSDTANLSVLGYDPGRYYSGRSPLEALSIGVDMAVTDISYRCNLVTLTENEQNYEDKTIIDHSSDEISTKDAAVLIDALAEGLGREGYAFYVGTSYRHLLIEQNGKVTEMTPPHDILARRIGEFLPAHRVLREMMMKSYDILVNHPLNIERKKQGLKPANSAWFWGAGTKPALTGFKENYGKSGAMISAVDLLKGIAAGAGMYSIDVEGATGGLHTNYEGKAKAAVKAMTEEGYDFVYVHIEAPDEMGHQGIIADKMQAIENVDKKVVSVICEGLEQAGEDYRMLVLPDHPTPICLRTHTADPVPYLLYDSTHIANGVPSFDEKHAAMTGVMVEPGHELIRRLFNQSV